MIGWIVRHLPPAVLYHLTIHLAARAGCEMPDRELPALAFMDAALHWEPRPSPRRPCQ